MLTLWPELMRFFTIPEPIMPRPRKPKESFDASMFLFFNASDMLFMSIVGESLKHRRNVVRYDVIIKTTF